MKRIQKKLLSFFRKSEKKKEIPTNGDSLHNKIWWQRYGLDIGIAILLAFLITLMFPKGKSFQFADLKEGRVYIGPEIIAPFTFPVNKSDEEYATDVKKARESVSPVFQKNEDIAEMQLNSLTYFTSQLVDTLKRSDATAKTIENLFRESAIVLSQEDIEILLNGYQNAHRDSFLIKEKQESITRKRAKETKEVADFIIILVKELYSAGILNVDKETLPVSLKKISIRSNNREMFEDLNFYFDLSESIDSLLEKLRNTSSLGEKKIKIGYQIASHYLVPNVLYDKIETDLRLEEAEANVPLAKDQVLAGERIIDSHQRIDTQHIDKLNSLAVAKAELGESTGFWNKISPGVGKFFTTIFILGILGIFLWRDRQQHLNDRKQLLLIELVILIIALMTFLANILSFSVYLIPVAIAAMIITIFFDAYIGILVSVCVSLLVGAMRGNEFGVTFVSIFVSSIVLMTVSRVRTRNWVIHSMIALVIANILAITVLDFLNYVPFRDMFQDWGFGAVNGFIVPIFAYGLIIIFESLFDMTTDMTLLELSDLNQPLLRQLAMEAPGSYHHSIMVGNLAESATEAVGGNALLARVGAYYHDIGKMEKPEYFVENQTRGHNPQEKLTPSMSSLILLNHVRKGAEIARQHGLPREIEAFIFEHHGTGLMTYFYQKAIEQNDKQGVSQNEYRYPGPRPNSRETAIVMLADAVEATSRTLKDPSPSRIKGLVEQIIDERFESGELDDSPLTLRDLSKISEAFQKILNGIFHARIEYPDVKEKQPEQQVIEKKEKADSSN